MDGRKQLVARVLAEAPIIVLSVFLALFLDEARTGWERQRALTAAMANVRAEMHSNLAIVREWHPYHQEILATFDEVRFDPARRDRVAPGGSVQLLRLMPGGLVQKLPSDTAWTYLRSSPLASSLDFETLTRIAKVYDLQQLGVRTTLDQLRIEMISRNTLDPTQLDVTLELFSRFLAELTSQEQFLIPNLEQALADLEPAKASSPG